jgi:hypothetical protein
LRWIIWRRATGSVSHQLRNSSSTKYKSIRLPASEISSLLPVFRATKFVLVINLKTAEELALDVPLHLQQLAHEVIE